MKPHYHHLHFREEKTPPLYAGESSLTSPSQPKSTTAPTLLLSSRSLIQVSTTRLYSPPIPDSNSTNLLLLSSTQRPLTPLPKSTMSVTSSESEDSSSELLRKESSLESWVSLVTGLFMKVSQTLKII